MEKTLEVEEILNEDDLVIGFKAILTATEGSKTATASGSNDYVSANWRPILDWPVDRIKNIGEQLRKEHDLDAIVEQKIADQS